MADNDGKISSSPVASTLEGAEFAGIQGGRNKRFPASLFNSVLIDGDKTAGNFIVANGSAWVTKAPPDVRETLGLGPLATADSVDDTVWDGEPLSVDHGGTGATEPGAARTALGIEIGTNVMGYSPHLEALVALSKADGNIVVTDGTSFDTVDVTGARSLLGLGTAALKNTGTSGDAVPILNVENTFGANQNIAPASGSAAIRLNKPATSGVGNFITGRTMGLNRWVISLGNATAESGANAGSDFYLTAYDDAGSSLYNPIYVPRSTGIPVFERGAVVGDGTGDPVTIQGTAVHSYSSGLLNNTSAADWKTDLGIESDLNRIPGGWVTATAYNVNDWLTYNNVAYICISAHTSGSTTEPGVGASWQTRWEANPFGAVSVSNVTNSQLANMAEATIKGRAAGAGTGSPQDLTASQARTAMGLGSAATAGFLDEDAMTTDSATAAPSQQSVKAYVDARRIPQVSGQAGLLALDGTVTPLALMRTAGGLRLFEWSASSQANYLLGPSLSVTAVSGNTMTAADHGLLPGMSVIIPTAKNGLTTNTIYWTVVPTIWAIYYNSRNATAFTVGQTLTNGSGASGTIHKVKDLDGAGIIWLSSLTGSFAQGNTITQGSASATADNPQFVVYDPDRFRLSTTRANAMAGTVVTLSGTDTTSFTVRRHHDPKRNIYVPPDNALNSASGTWCLADRFIRPLTLYDFDVLASNTGADNNDGVSIAINFPQMVTIPNGYFKVTSKFWSIGGAVLRGYGSQYSNLYWENADTFGIELYYTLNRSERVQGGDFGMVTNDTATSSFAIKVDGTTRIVATAGNGVFDMGSLDRIEVRGFTAPGTDGWRGGFWIYETVNFSLNDCSFVGYFNGSESNIISIYGFRSTSTSNGAGSVMKFNNCRAYYAIYGGDTDTVEETKYMNCTFVAVENGVRGRKTQTKVAPVLCVESTHINARVYGIDIDGWQQINLIGNRIYQRPSGSEAGAGIRLTNCLDGHVMQNLVVRNNATGQVFDGVQLGSGTDGLEVDFNIGRDTTAVIRAQSGSTNNLIGSSNKAEVVGNPTMKLFINEAANANLFGSRTYTAINSVSAVIATSTDSNLVSISLTNVASKTRYRFYTKTRCAKGATAGLTELWVAQTAGTANVVFDALGSEVRESFDAPASSVRWKSAPSGYIEITSPGASGTLTLTLRGNSTGSNTTFTLNNCQLMLEQIV